jgi:hypothetical protein
MEVSLYQIASAAREGDRRSRLSTRNIEPEAQRSVIPKPRNSRDVESACCNLSCFTYAVSCTRDSKLEPVIVTEQRSDVVHSYIWARWRSCLLSISNFADSISSSHTAQMLIHLPSLQIIPKRPPLPRSKYSILISGSQCLQYLEN